MKTKQLRQIHFHHHHPPDDGAFAY